MVVFPSIKSEAYKYVRLLILMVNLLQALMFQGESAWSDGDGAGGRVRSPRSFGFGKENRRQALAAAAASSEPPT